MIEDFVLENYYTILWCIAGVAILRAIRAVWQDLKIRSSSYGK